MGRLKKRRGFVYHRPKNENIRFYCKYHKWVMSSKQISAKKCKKRECRHLVKVDNYVFVKNLQKKFSRLDI